MIAVLGVLNSILTLLWIAILVRAILSWLPLSPNNPVIAVVMQVTEPVLSPIRRLLPRTGAMDLSPMIAIIVIILLQQLLLSVMV